MDRTLDTYQSVAQRIQQWVIAHFPAAAQQNISIDDSLLDSGIVDSMGTLEIVEYLEDELGVEVSDDDMVADHFESVSSIAKYACTQLGIPHNPMDDSTVTSE
ncbi:acyl carrier protein [Aporhodopirellula aestuarii]|uniref:Acyl carrier protein n=1 Tax=Aporhodopirellula aestuarii TaxID=2950107 RepID=A0ABT0UDY7_9BACT|nr:acyl carrier protein [Aporhodopirellula aestuarii]MCM2375135.1 acyl carrier protein [Aporhodopirellula aestuarii]